MTALAYLIPATAFLVRMGRFATRDNVPLILAKPSLVPKVVFVPETLDNAKKIRVSWFDVRKVYARKGNVSIRAKPWNVLLPLSVWPVFAHKTIATTKDVLRVRSV